ncbi:MAG: hypothetical protein IKK85_09935 [Clostridia bacterium]|nr:hypothetical protein [Clostridia bacterium]
MKNKIICLVLSLVFIAGVFGVNGTYAWFPSYGEGAGGVLHNFQSGNMGYTLVGDFADNTASIEPLQNLVKEDASFYLINNSAIDTQVRVKVSYTYFDAAGNRLEALSSFVSTSDNGAPFVAELATDSNSKTYWSYNDADGYFYYDDPAIEGTDDTIQGLAENVTQQIIPLFSAMYYSGKNSVLPSGSFGEGKTITVKLIFEAKQAEHVTWKVLGEIEKVPDPTTTVQAS